MKHSLDAGFPRWPIPRRLSPNQKVGRAKPIIARQARLPPRPFAQCKWEMESGEKFDYPCHTVICRHEDVEVCEWLKDQGSGWWFQKSPVSFLGTGNKSRVGGTGLTPKDTKKKNY